MVIELKQLFYRVSHQWMEIDRVSHLPSLGWRLAVTFSVVALLYFDPVPNGNALNILDLATSMVDHGNVELDEHEGGDRAMRDGQILSGVPPGASFVAALVYLITRPLFYMIPSGVTLPALNALCVVFVNIPAAAFTVYLVYRIALSWCASIRNAVITAGLFAFGTMHFGYATGFWKNTVAVALLVGAFWLLICENGAKSNSIKACLAGFLCGFAIGVDYPAALIVAGFCCLFLYRRPGFGVAMAFIVGVGVGLLPMFIYHQVAFGSPFANAYQYRISLTHRVGFEFGTLGMPQPRPFIALLAKLLVASPFLVWSVIGMRRAIKVREIRPVMLAIAGMFLGSTLFISGFFGYVYHEASFASRHLLLVLPFAVLPTAFGLPDNLKGWSLFLIGWSVGATFLAAQAVMIPWDTAASLYAFKVLFTSWGTGPLFSDALPSWLGIQTLHHAVMHNGVTINSLLSSGHRSALIPLLLGQGMIKVISLSATTIAAIIVWQFVWKPILSFRKVSPS
jgi:hypothetical protein